MIKRSDFIYPGHPLVIAWFITKNYKNLQDAENPLTGALGSCNIPGAGGGVHAALDCLWKLSNGLSLMEVIDFANYHWKVDRDNGYSNVYLKGLEQASKVLPELISEQWWTNTPGMITYQEMLDAFNAIQNMPISVGYYLWS